MEAETKGHTGFSHQIVETRDCFQVQRAFAAMDEDAINFLWNGLGIDERHDRDEIPERTTITGREFLLHALHRSAANNGGRFFIVMERNDDGIYQVFVASNKETALTFSQKRLMERG